ncbi:cysteine desulfurase family protein [Dermatophilus congolensis]|uniref:cysteine desulfurase family protein n=1 Tax=Dermatophilus congolensis TaxID=1863 RepID=UPI000E0F6508|nr:cysteine desulfurase family protein [Dermatophilus congolensis]
MRRAYLDHAATAPTRSEVVAALSAALQMTGNPSAQHDSGRRARSALEEARENVADLLRVRPSEVLFTSGGTESDNIGILGTYRRCVADNPSRRRIIMGAIEHPAVRDAVFALEKNEGATITIVAPRPDGIIATEDIRAAIEDPNNGGPDNVALVTVMAVNNEIGTIQPTAAIAETCAEHAIAFHCDAVQGISVLDLPLDHPGITTAALSGHKLGSPVGIGVLIARRDARIAPISYGGGQERALRSGTLGLALARSFETALHSVVTHRDTEVARLVALRDRLAQGILESIPDAHITGAWAPTDTTQRSASNVHVLIPQAQGDSLLFLLDAAGVECSTGSACHSGVTQPSHVVLALGHDAELATGALRFSLGYTTTDADIDLALTALPEAVERARNVHRLTTRKKTA